MKDSLKNKYIQFKFKIWEWYRLHILHQHDCENCLYFGGLMCNHVDEEGNCLTWEQYKYKFIKEIIFQYRLKKLRKKVNKALKKLEEEKKYEKS